MNLAKMFAINTLCPVCSSYAISVIILCQLVWCVSSQLAPIRLSVMEGTPANQFIGSILPQSNLTVTVPQPSTDITRDLIINPDGTVYTKRLIDREAVVNGVYNFIVIFSNGSALSIVIMITDINDNSPAFPPPLTRYFNISEGTLMTISLPTATDRDNGTNGVQRYVIMSGDDPNNPKFRIITTQGLETLDPSLRVIQKLDYETQSQYILLIRAFDGGNRTSDLTVNITVTDINDNPPIFTSSMYIASIREDAGVGTVVTQVTASDSVEDESVMYSINRQLSTDPLTQFVINSATGQITVNRALNYDTQQSYQLTVVALDVGVPPQQASATVQITVININNGPQSNVTLSSPLTTQPPSFSSLRYTVNISEYTPVGSFVLQVTTSVTQVRYQLQQESVWFTVNANSGVITTLLRLDCESQQTEQLVVEGYDPDLPQMTSSTTIIINIINGNDNQPQFEQSLYSALVSENEHPGYCFIQVQATDGDCGSGDQITYSFITDRPPGNMTIDPVSGQICLTGQLAYRRQSMYHFKVKATDEGGLFSEAQVQVVVSPVNEDPGFRPVFSQQVYAVNLNRATPVGTQVLVVSATDVETTAFIIYRIVGSNSLDIFSIDKYSGILTLRSPLPPSAVSFTLFVSAQSDLGLPSYLNAQINITVLDSLTALPVFNGLPYAWSIVENAGIGTSVSQLQATGFGAITYTLATDTDHFSLDSKSGLLSVSGSLDSETDPTELLTVIAQMGSPPVYAQTVVNISILDANDYSPSFGFSSVTVTVSENSPIGSVLYVLQASDQDSGLFGLVTYQMINSSGTFLVKQSTGALVLIRRLDYEVQRVYSFVVRASDGVGLWADVTVTVQVTDYNDHQPIFRQAAYLFTASENATIGTIVGSVFATDADSGANGRVAYYVQNILGEETFGVYANTGGLYTLRALDWEVQSNHTFEVLVVDDGHPRQMGMCQVTILVNDTNDNDPMFTNVAYTFYVLENQPSATPVGQVQAIDLDYPQVMAYDLESLSFYINRTSGWVYTSAPLDRETRGNYTLNVSATDSGSPPRTMTTEVFIFVLDMNEHPPSIHTPLTITVIKTAPKGTNVSLVTASDPDLLENATVTYFLPGSQAFAIDPYTGVVILQQYLDYETAHTLNFTVIAQDAGRPPRSSTTLVMVNVTNIVDKLLLGDNPVLLTVPENQPLGTVIGYIPGAGAGVRFYQLPGSRDLIVNGTTGAVVVSKQLDYEATHYVQVQVRASGATTSTLYTVTVNITDANDNAPQFEQDLYNVSMRELLPLGYVVYTVTAIDLDSGPRGLVQYDIVSQTPASQNWFNIDRQTGSLTTATNILYGDVPQISLVIRGTDQPGVGQAGLASTTTVCVTVTDINDHTPVFNTRSQVDIMEDEPLEYPVIHITATDEDSVENGRVEYYIERGNQQEQFYLQPDTGLLTVVKPLDRETTPTYDLDLVARDNGVPRLSTHMTLRVSLMDFNDNAPTFSQHLYRVEISEATPPGGAVAQVTATDLDQGVNSLLTFSLPDGTGQNQFGIDNRTGQIVTTKTLDREIQDQYNITVTVYDGGRPQLSDSCVVVIIVSDVNDHPPVFLQQALTLTTPENTPQLSLHTVVAYDLDIGTSALVTYNITGGNTNDVFTIDADSGRLSCSSLDRETHPNYTLTVEARDQGTPALSSTLTISVIVNDTNDNDPWFSQTGYSVVISEGVPIGSLVLVVTATDTDAGLNGLVSFSLGNDALGVFTIDNTTGVINTSEPLDRERQSLYLFTVFATDNCPYDPHMSQVYVSVTVSDVNDNSPEFTNLPASVNIQPTTASGISIFTVQATDPDARDNGTVVYSLATPNPNFELSGAILRTTQILGVGVYRVVITAQDKGTPPRSTNDFLEVIVGSPSSALKFNRSVYSATIPENSPVGTTLTRVAINTDGGTGVTFSLDAGYFQGTFAINSLTGIITVADPTKLDYEMQHSLQVFALANNSNFIAYVPINVTLSDVNDNSPVFSQDRYVSAVWEGNSRYTYVTQIRATDADSGPNGDVVYYIKSGNSQNVFQMVALRTGIIATNSILDRETQDSYRLVIEASDNGVPPKTSDCVLKIQVIDTNDNEPFFPYQFSRPVQIYEDMLPGSTVIQVTANDNDLYPILKYSFTSNGNPGDKFAVDSTSGKITVAKDLDYEQTSQYALKIQVSDSVHFITTDVNIQLLDRNDHRPTFTSSLYQTTIDEGVPVNSTALWVSAVDKDYGRNGNITYSMTSDDFSIDPVTGLIRTRRVLVFTETRSTYELVVVVQDSGELPLQSLALVKINLRDINNNAPLFDQQLYSRNISEDATYGEEVVTVTAVDADVVGDNKKVDYSIISGNVDQSFQIGTSTGQIVLLKLLDREKQARYNLTIQAVDRGVPSLTGYTTVVVVVEDVNDNGPRFNLTSYSVTVPENTTLNSTLLTVRAFDPDQFPKVTYRIFSGDNNMFAIGQSTGVISLAKALDYERQSLYSVIVWAEDQGIANFCEVKVSVADVDEFTPVFLVYMYYETVMEQQDPGQLVFIAQASDQDTGPYGVLQYSLEGADAAYFRIDPGSGAIYTKASFVYSVRNAMDFYIRATDKGGRFARIPVHVDVELKFVPHFAQDSYGFSVPGNAMAGYVVGRVSVYNAYDNSTSDSQGKVIYSLVSVNTSSQYFNINASGFIYVLRSLQADASRRKRALQSINHSIGHNINNSFNHSVDHSVVWNTLSGVPRPRALSGVPRPRALSSVLMSHVLSGVPRSRRAVSDTVVTLIVRASTGYQGQSSSAFTTVQITVSAAPQASTSSSTTTTQIAVIVAVLVTAAIVIGVVVLVICIRRKRLPRKSHESGQHLGGSFDSSYDGAKPAPPPYYTQTSLPTGSNGSSGRGSTNDMDDEEIRQINSTPLDDAHPDSGIINDDGPSDPSPQNHREYYESLGIDPEVLHNKLKSKSGSVGASVESIHQFSEEGGGEGVEGGGGGGVSGGGEALVNTEEELSGSYNWDYMLDWQPRYQHLADVFTEIAGLKDEYSGKKVPTRLVPQTGVNKPARLDPPPIITNQPPRTTTLAQPIPSHTSTSRLSSVSSMPKSPMSYESHFTSPPMTPNIETSLTHLDYCTPSFSPIVSTRGLGSSSSQGTTSARGLGSSSSQGTTPRNKQRTAEQEFTI